MNIKYLTLIIICFAGIYSNCLAQNDDAHQAELIAKANYFYNKGEYKKAAKKYNAIYKLKNLDNFEFYQAASSNAHIDEAGTAIYYLKTLITTNRLKRYDSLLTDPNFLNLHADRRWHDVDYLIRNHEDDIEHRYGKTIKQELIEMRGESINQKIKLDSFITAYGARSKKVVEQRSFIKTRDSVNYLKVQSIIHTYGYMGPKIIGPTANQVMFNIILNMDLSTAKGYIPILWQAFLKGDASASNYAALVDRVSLKESYTQVYGTILLRKDGAYYAPSVTDTVKVDSLRKQIGLPPFKEYLKEFGGN